MGIETRFHVHYESIDESARLWGTPLGELTRLRTWDIFDRFLPAAGRVADIGGGPGTHATHLADRGYSVCLVDRSHTTSARRSASAVAGSIAALVTGGNCRSRMNPSMLYC